MPILGNSWTARITLIVAIACLYVGAVQVNNNLLFPALEFAQFRNWIFLPAGLKLLLLILFGWRAAIGIALAIATVTLSEIEELGHIDALGLGVLGSFPALATMFAVTALLGLHTPWAGITFKHILVLSIAIGLTDAVVQHMGLSLIDVSESSDYPEHAVQSALGRILGSMLFLQVAAHAMKNLREQAADHHPQPRPE